VVLLEALTRAARQRQLQEVDEAGGRPLES
jgi:hypothetical protein